MEAETSSSPSEWMPKIYYEEVSITEMVPGPRRVVFTAKVVNLYDQSVTSKMPKAAKGCLKVLARDESTVILVRANTRITDHPL